MTRKISHQNFLKRQSQQSPHEEQTNKGPFDEQQFNFQRDLSTMSADDLRLYIRQIKQGIRYVPLFTL